MFKAKPRLRSKPRERYLFTSRHKKNRQKKLTVFGVLASGVLFVLVLELVTRIFIDITGQRAQFTEQQPDVTIEDTYQLQFVSEEALTEDPEPVGLKAKRALSVGYQLLGNQSSPYWQINQQGFRDSEPISVTKPTGEVRIFILGSSTAFGYGSGSNEAAIAEVLETRLAQRLQQQKSSPQAYKPDILPADPAARATALKKPSKLKPANYRVINAAVPGYTSGNQLAQLALEVTKYQPDLIVVLNGYEDLMLSGQETATQIPQPQEYLDDAPSYMVALLNRWLEPIQDKSYVVQILQNSLLEPADPNEATLIVGTKTGQELAAIAPQDQTELQRRIDRYFANHQQIVNLAKGANAKVILATQPEITGRNPSKLTPTEGEIVTQLGRKYIQTIKDNYPRFVGANNYVAKLYPQQVKSLNLYNLSDKYPSPSFIDAVHLTEPANAMVAEQLYYAIASFNHLQLVPKEAPKPQKIEQKVDG